MEVLKFPTLRVLNIKIQTSIEATDAEFDAGLEDVDMSPKTEEQSTTPKKSNMHIVLQDNNKSRITLEISQFI